MSWCSASDERGSHELTGPLTFRQNLERGFRPRFRRHCLVMSLAQLPLGGARTAIRKRAAPHVAPLLLERPSGTWAVYDFINWTKDELDDFEDYLIERQRDKWWSPPAPAWVRPGLSDIAPELASILQRHSEMYLADEMHLDERRKLALRAWRLLSPHISRSTFWELTFLVLPRSHEPVRLLLRDRKASELSKHHSAETPSKRAARLDHAIGLQVLRAYRSAVRAKASGALESAIEQVAEEHGLSDHRIKQRYDSFRDAAFADGIADPARIDRLGRGIIEGDPIRLSDFPKPWRSRVAREEL